MPSSHPQEVDASQGVSDLEGGHQELLLGQPGLNKLAEEQHALLKEGTPIHARERTLSGSRTKGPGVFIACLVVLLCLWRVELLRDSWKMVITSSSPLHSDGHGASILRRANQTAAVLEVFQVYQPVINSGQTLTASNDPGNAISIAPTAAATNCQVLLMNHTFAYSYGLPFVATYIPPKCKFNRVTLNFTVTSKGRQFDRLAVMYFNDTEVWRTSTAEPNVNGIRWTYIKDTSEYLYFWNSPQTLIFDLGNLVDSTYTGLYNTTLTATFFNGQDTVDPADLIIPISARQGADNSSSLFILPANNATNTISFPRNVNRAVFSVSATGQADEEFWWSNVLQSDIATFEAVDGTMFGYSPFREVQVLIDGQLAGVHWPFPIVFTGGIVPSLWRPIVGIDAFDLREHEIDITPWLPILCNGVEHSFEIRVIGILDDGKTGATITETVGNSWYVTGKIFVWLDDDATSVTTGNVPTFQVPAPVISISQSIGQDSTGANETLSYTTNVKRQLSISSTIKTQKGTQLSTWTQSLSVINSGYFSAYGAVQLNNQTTTGVDQSTGRNYYKSSYSYPLYVNSTLDVQASGNFTIDADIVRGLNLGILGSSIYPSGVQPVTGAPLSTSLGNDLTGSIIRTTQNGTAHYFASPSAQVSSGFGSTSQEFSFLGTSVDGTEVDVELYSRDVEAINGTVTKDIEKLVGKEVTNYTFPVKNVEGAQTLWVARSPNEVIGRGPK